METMQNIRAIDSLDDMTGIIKNELESITGGFISVGYYLRKTADDGLYRQKGYANIYDYAKQAFGISRPTASRFMEINEKYSVGGYSPEIEEKWRNYGSSKLTEMLGLPEDIREEVPQEATVRDIREVKGVIRETEKHYDDQMELCDIAQETKIETNWMEKLVKELFREQKQAFEKMVDWVRKDNGESREEIEEDILAIVNPTKFRMIRLDMANVLMQEKCIRVMPYRGRGEMTEYDYVQLAAGFEELFYPNYPDIQTPIQKVYENVYGAPLYEEPPEPKKKLAEESREKPQESGKKPQESEKKHPENAEEEPKKEPEKEGKIEPEKEEQTEPEKEEKNESVKKPGDTVNTVSEEDSEEREEAAPKVERFYQSRKTYMGSLPRMEWVSYMAKTMEKVLERNEDVKALATEAFWKDFCDAEVDGKGEEIECVS